MADEEVIPPVEEQIPEAATADDSDDSAVEIVTNPSEAASKIGTIEETKYGKLKYISIVQEMRKSYLDYAMSVIVSRALPDVRDGLKPVHRRILYSMYKSGIHHTSSYKKSARIVGDVLGKYHPHGDAPVYGALVRLAQDFSMRYMLIDGQGNFGSVDGDSPAAMRYTEARLAKISSELLSDLDKNTVPYTDNFDGSLKEPTVLPGKLPNLLLMGSEGIAVGMATKIPPHNLREVCGAIIKLIEMGAATRAQAVEIPEITSNDIKSPEHIKQQNATIDALLATDSVVLAGDFQTNASIEDIMEIVQGPDFPTGGTMYDFAEIKEAYRTGKGKVVIRAKASIDENKILVTELPYQVNKARLLMKIADLVKDKKIEGIRDLNDDSDRTGMQITIELKRDARPKVVLNKLFKYSELQTSFPINMVALTSEGLPQLLNIRQILMEYIAHRQNMIVRRSQYELIEARNRAHILEGLLIALGNLDEVIETIRRSPDTDTARTRLMEKFGLSEIQATAILEMQLKRLAALERQKIEDEYKEIQKSISALITLLESPIKILGVITDEVNGLIEQYGDDRKTKLVKGRIGEFSESDLVPNEATVITLTESGYVKRLSPAAFRAQSRGGKGSIGLKMKTEDMLQAIVTSNTHDNLLFFTNLGRVFKMRAFEIPEASRQAKGTAMVNLLNLKGDERVQAILAVDDEVDKNKYIMLATQRGLVKKTAVKLFDNIRQNGIIAIMLNDDDKLVWGKVTTGKDDVMLISHKGKCIRFSELEVKTSQRDTKGVKGITLQSDDYVIGVETITKEEEKDESRQLLVITENGMGKRTLLSQYPVQKRSGMGVKVSDISKRTGMIADARKITPESKAVVISSKNGQTIKLPVSAQSLPILTRPTQGVILMRLTGSDTVAAVTLTSKEEAEVSDESDSSESAETVE